MDVAPLLGLWTVQNGTASDRWTFNTDGTVASNNGLPGMWWEDGERIQIAWLPYVWVSLPLPLDPHSAHGDSSAGEGKLTMLKK